MTDSNQSSRNPALSLGLLIAVSAILCNFIFFLNPPAQSLIPWLSLLLGIIGLLFTALGVKNLIQQPRTPGARVFGSLVALISLLLSAGIISFFFLARAVPPSTDSPQVGQKAPDFTLPDTHNAPVSLTQLFAPSATPAPRAVLLIFYRGYW